MKSQFVLSAEVKAATIRSVVLNMSKEIVLARNAVQRMVDTRNGALNM